MNVKIIGGNRNQERRARHKEAKRFMKMESPCKDESCKDDNCKRESTESEETGNTTKNTVLFNVFRSAQGAPRDPWGPPRDPHLDTISYY